MKYQIISSSSLKIIACIFMIIDHFALTAYTVDRGVAIGLASENYELLRILGRIAFPIFAYLIIDGLIHTKNKQKYLFRLLVLAFIVSAFEILFTGSYSGNPITCLFLSGLSIYFLELKSWRKLLAVLPLTYIFLAFFNIIAGKVSYNIYGYFLILLYYLAYLIVNLMTRNSMISSKMKTNYRNILSSGMIVLMCLFFYFMARYSNIEYFKNQSLQIYSLYAVIPILLYNGNRGYNAKWFKYFWYLFYPVHIGVIYLIYNLIIII